MAAKKKSAAAKTVAKTAGNKLSPATKTAPSGATIEPEIAEQSVTDHPAIDANPRKGVKADANRIDLNDPAKDDAAAVEENLGAQK